MTVGPYHPAHHASGSVRGAIIVLAVAIWIAWYSFGLIAPPPGQCEAAPVDAFSSSRAMTHVEALAAEPRPVGSAANGRARTYLRSRLQRLGFEVSIQRVTVVQPPRRGQVVGAAIQNVVARRAGTRGAGPALLLAAHYDSRPETTGAGDDASGVAAILESLRALEHGEPLANDLIVLFTDGEELGLLGARGFVENHPWAEDVGLVLNFESRGARGTSTMFETGPSNLAVVTALAATPFPMASSFSGEIYRRMPNDTDFSVFRDAGRQGLNFAFLEGFEAYHTALDTAAGLSRASLQHHGDTALALVRELGGVDLPLPSDGDSVYFNTLGFRLVSYPASWSLPLALGLLTLLGGLLEWSRRLRMVTLRGVGLGAAIYLGGLAIAGFGAGLGWTLLRRVAPQLMDAPNGVPWDHRLVTLSLALLVVGLLASFYGLAGRGTSPFSVYGGTLLASAVIGALVAAVAPGGSYLFAWPLAVGSVGWAIVVWRRGDFDTTSTLMGLLAAAGLVAGVLFGPLLVLAYLGLTLHAIAPVAVLFSLWIGLFALPLTLLGRSRWFPATMVGLAIAGMSLVVVRAGSLPSDDRPGVGSLLYVQTTDESYWASFDDAPDVFSDTYLGDAEPAILEGPLGGHSGLRADAPRLDVIAPSVNVVRTEQMIGGREVEIRIASRRGASTLRVVAEPREDGTVKIVALDGQEVEITGDGPGATRLVFFGGSGGSRRVVVQVTGDGLAVVHVIDQTRGLPNQVRPEGASAARPPSSISSSNPLNDSLLVVSTVRL